MSKITNLTFYNEVKKLCVLKNLTIDAVVREATGGKSGYTSFQGWERRGLYPRLDIALGIAKALGVKLNYLTEEPEENSYKELIELFESQTPEVKNQIIQLMKTTKK